MLQPTPEHLLTDSEGRPYFLWDCEMTVEELRAGLLDPDRRVRAYLAGKVMRQAKPDDVFQFLSLQSIADLWPDLQRYLGTALPFWRWILREWGVVGDG